MIETIDPHRDKEISRSGQAVIILGHYYNSDHIKIPIIIKKFYSTSHFFDELMIYAFMRKNPHISMINMISFNQEKNEIYLEYIDGHNLGEYSFNNSNEKVNIIKQILNSFIFMHSLGLYHRDIKPENIIFSKTGVIKVIDFATSCFNTRKPFCIQTVGTPGFIAPELLREEKSDYLLSDVYSIGMTFYYIITSEYPSEEDIDYNLIKDDMLLKIILSMTDPDPRGKLTMVQIKDIYEDIDFKEIK